MLEKTQILQKIDALSAIAAARMSECNPGIAGVMGGAPIDFMQPSERQELHALKLQLPSYAQERAEAKDRIARRIAQRKASRIS
jgi:hypothetical protein